ncbi:MAG TPA: TRAP transporter small permease subunit [Syntrophales bacterium]|nr:TRAP transporter small permease subunit [Syntrophales bacterium]HPQ43764.1 TRAP transporter small permease subunit [Syntrophales bacterium]
MVWMKKLSKVLDAVSEWTGTICVWIVVPLMLVMVYEVVTRRFFNRPGVWAFETAIQIYAFHFMILASYTLLKKKHISVDIVVTRWSPKTRAILEMITSLVLFFPFMVVILIEGTYYAQESWAIKEVSYTVFAPPIYPIKTLIPLTALLLLIQGVSDFLKNMLFISKGEQS